MPSMGVVEKRAVTINVSLDALVKNMSDSARVECGRKLGAVCVFERSAPAREFVRRHRA